jgi:hypothetical protein
MVHILGSNPGPTARGWAEMANGILLMQVGHCSVLFAHGRFVFQATATSGQLRRVGQQAEHV